MSAGKSRGEDPISFGCILRIGKREGKLLNLDALALPADYAGFGASPVRYEQSLDHVGLLLIIQMRIKLRDLRREFILAEQGSAWALKHRAGKGLDVACEFAGRLRLRSDALAFGLDKVRSVRDHFASSCDGAGTLLLRLLECVAL